MIDILMVPNCKETPSMGPKIYEKVVFNHKKEDERKKVR